MSENPPVFRATYSNTAVYECIMNDSPIMRRCKDDWVNATQILKCCNFPKAKRTKILEKGVQQGLHEKVQGGFGRFQGTWIPLDDARKLAETYGLTKELAPVLFLDFEDPDLVIPEKVKPAPKEPVG
ncbi:Transcriptional SBF complex/cell-cycle-box DNA binding subunit, putative, partial [Candida maltosa Xu316]